MAKQKAPAFQFYPKDFLTDERVVLMSNTELGVYMRLMCFCWLEGTLPLETDSLSRLARMPLRQFTNLWENGVVRQCFQMGEDGRLHHKRLDEERRKQVAYNNEQSENGKAGASKRWGRHSEANGVAIETPLAKNSSSSPSPSPDSSQRRTPLTPSKSGPLPGFLRLRLFPWMWEKLKSSAGSQFDVEQWLADLENDDRLAIPVTDSERWTWLQGALDFELKRLGLIAAAPAAPTNKRVAGLVAGGDAFLRRNQG